MGRNIEKEVKILTQIAKNEDYELMKDSLSSEERKGELVINCRLGCYFGENSEIEENKKIELETDAWVIIKIKRMESDDYHFKFKIALIGDTNVGKSTLIDS